VAIYDFGIDTGEIYIVMELADGNDLKSIIEDNGPFSIMEGLDIGIQICSGLGYAHRAGIVHCDVKSQNILLTKDKIAKITDFGIARAMSATTSAESEDVVWGSPHYMAPELIDGAPSTPQADVYSIGAVLYEIFTGKPPFEGVSINDVLDNHKNSDVKPIRSLVPGFPEELDLIIQKVLSKEASLRYRTANQLGNVLLTAKYHLEHSINQTQPRSYSSPPPFPVPPPLSLEDTRSLIEPKNTVDWPMVGIELLCLLMVGGLIPFWLYVYYSVIPLLR
jgi:serine/threonine-protein kinase